MTRTPTFRIPLSRELVPVSALAALAPLGGRVLLESAAGRGRSILSAAPRRVLRWEVGQEGHDPFDGIAELLDDEGAALVGLPGEPDPPFAGGWIGYLGYEVGDLLERLPPPAPAEPGELPSLWLGAFDWAVVWPRGGGAPALEGAPLPGGDPAELRRRLREVEALLAGASGEGVASRREAPGEGVGTGWYAAGAGCLPPGVESSLGRAGFEAGVERIREYIRAGDLFQANLTHRLQLPWAGTGEALYRALRVRSPGPYSACLETGEGEVASISPEAFLTLRGGRVTTRPIKGTAPRGGDAEADRASGKDRAENVMIVDLLRNDLSRVCRPGTVRVPELAILESHPTVHHLVSTVEGELEEGCGPVELLRATLPGGSITGAPKIRAMEVLRELEPVRRGVYTGALGVIERSGAMELSIAIRTATLGGGVASYGAGGGITLDSDPEGEWLETLDKARPFLELAGEGA